VFSQIIALLRPVLEFLTVQTGNFGIALILFTIGVKIFLIPLIFKQQKSMVAMQKVQPLIKELQEKYKNDKEKLNMETMKLYKEHKVNPLASCFPMLIQMPVLFSMWFLIQEIVNDPYVYVDGIRQVIDFSFLGLDLSQVPNFDMSGRNFFGIDWIWIIPILAGATTYLSSRLMQKMNAGAQMTTPDGKNPMQSMMLFFPIFTLGIAFTFPAGVGLYWTISNLLQTGQQWGVNKFLKSKSNPETEVIEVNANKNRKNRKKR